MFKIAQITTGVFVGLMSASLPALAQEANHPQYRSETALRKVLELASKQRTAQSSGASEVLWRAGMETGDLSEWSRDGGGNAYTYLNDAPDSSGKVLNQASRYYAHSGEWSARWSIPTSPADYPELPKASLWRWTEPSNFKELYYSVWYFIPQRYEILTHPCCGWLNLFQFHALNASERVANGVVLFVNTRKSTGGMYFRLSINPRFLPDKNEFRSPIDLPIGRWFNVEVRFRCAAHHRGAVQVWQDGVQIFHLENVTTGLPGKSTCHWGINDYGQYILPSPVVIYVDDAAISRNRIGPPLAPSAAIQRHAP